MAFKFSVGNGIAVKFGNDTVLFDPKVSDFISFISHAHSDHSPTGFVTKPYCTEETYALIKLRDPFFEANVVKENKKIDFDNFSAKFLNSGHVLGGAQILIEADGKKIIYSGDFKLGEGLTAKPIRIENADVLITESTYGSPEYAFPPVESVRQQIISWVKDQLSQRYLVDIGGYQIGKAQEAIKLLNEHGITPKATETIRRYSEVYNKFGVGLKFLKQEEQSDVLVKPMHLLKNRRSDVKTCALTGWSSESNVGFERPKPFFGFPLSDHCDFNQIMEYVKQVDPKIVYCVHGYTNILAKEIKKKFKITAKSLETPINIRGQKLLTEF